MNKRLVLGAVAAFLVIFNLGYDNVSLPAMLVDSTYHTLEGVLAGIIGAAYRSP